MAIRRDNWRYQRLVVKPKAYHSSPSGKRRVLPSGRTGPSWPKHHDKLSICMDAASYPAIGGPLKLELLD